jgi:pyruvate/2-oxoglutarate dehydrogenase complex dihydrolipoamide dehydrogenase (E3) component
MNGRSLHPDAVLFAAGRSVNTNGLGLEEAGVEMDTTLVSPYILDTYFHVHIFSS